MINIGIIVPVCSRHQNYQSIEDIDFLKYLYPSIEKTKEKEFNYVYFIGYDDDDIFFKQYSKELSELGFNIYELSGCQNAPSKAWNLLAEKAFNYKETMDYFFQVGDDVIMETKGWTSHFIKKLEDKKIGVVGPCNLRNHLGRMRNKDKFVIENSFVHRTHFQIFGYYFYPQIMNWYCDDWITRLYEDYYSEIFVDYTCINKSLDLQVGNRYKVIMCPEIKNYINEGKEILQKYFN